jgi:hypothetical protein
LTPDYPHDVSRRTNDRRIAAVTMHAPAESEYAAPYAGYIAKVAEHDDLAAFMERQRRQLAELPSTVGAAREMHSYGDGKWTVRQLVGHLADAERIFGYRLLCVSRGETQSLPGFDETRYAEHSRANGRTLADLVAELVALRDANVALVKNLDEEALVRQGVANGMPITARALAYVIPGHCQHHLDILAERYGIAVA